MLISVAALVPGEVLAHSVGLLLIPTLGPVLAVSGVVVFIAVRDRRQERAKRRQQEDPDQREADGVDANETKGDRTAVRLRWAALALAVGFLPACDSDPAAKPTNASQSTATHMSSPAPAPEDSPARIDVEIDHGGVRPTAKRVEVKVGQKVIFNVTSDVSEQLHVHSDPPQSFDIKPVRDQEFSLTIDVPGQVEVEAEGLGISIVTLVVRP